MLELKGYELALVEELRLPLINHFYSECTYNVKCGRQDRVYSFSAAGKIIAAARLMQQPSHCFLLRNLCVLPSLRGQGVATNFVAAIVADVAPQHCYCYALPHLKNFYLALGFNELTIAQVPTDIGATHRRNQIRKRGWILMGYCQ